MTAREDQRTAIGNEWRTRDLAQESIARVSAKIDAIFAAAQKPQGARTR